MVEFDTGLNSAMRKLRIALGDDAETPRYIETLPRKGYRFIGRIERRCPPIAGIPSLPSQYVPTSFETGAVIGRRASDRRAPLKRLAWGFGSILAAVVLAVVAWRMPGKLFQADAAAENTAHHRGAAAGRHERRPERAGAVRRPHRRAVELAGAHPHAARGGAHFGVRLQGQEHRRARNRAGSSAPRMCSKAACVARATRCASPCSSSRPTPACTSGRESFDLPIGDIFLIEDTVSRAVAEALHLKLSADTAEQWAQRQPEKMEALRAVPAGPRAPAQAHRRRQPQGRGILPARGGTPIRNTRWRRSAWRRSLLNGLSLNRAPLEDVTAEAEPLINRALASARTCPMRSR